MEQFNEKTEILKNPEKLPLHSLYLEKKILQKKQDCPSSKSFTLESLDKFKKIDFSKYYTTKFEKHKAISSVWILKNRTYHNYYPYYAQCSKEEAEEFIEKNALFLESIKHLLDCTYRYFWCYILCEPRINKILNDFLSKATFYYDLKYMDSSCLEIYEYVCSAVYRIYLRMFTFKVSETEFMPEDVVIEYLEKYNYLNIKNLMILLLLYSPSSCSDFADKIINDYFKKKQEEKIRQDLLDYLGKIATEMDTIYAQVCDNYEGAVALSSIKKGFDQIWFEDIASQVLYFAFSLNTFFSKCKSYLGIAAEAGLIERITSIYENVFPELYRNMNMKEEVPSELLIAKKRIAEKIALGRSELVNLFNLFVSDSLENILTSGNDSNAQHDHFENYLKFINLALECEEFIKDYHAVYKVNQQIEIIGDVYPETDKTRTDYILECLQNLSEAEEEEEEVEVPGKVLETISEEKSQDIEYQPIPSTSRSYETDNDIKPSEEEIYGLIDIVLDACPDVESGFIMQCLERMNYDPIDTIKAIQANNLPKELNSVPKDSVFIPPEKPPEPEKPILEYRGKKPQYRDTVALLDDKTDMQDVKDFILKSTYGSYDPYDDEYDDRQEDDPYLNFDDKTDIDEILPGLNRLNGYEVVSDPSELSDDEKEAAGDQNKPKDSFCENPEEVRARRNQYYKRGGKSGSSREDRGVAGKPKGQGQDKNVQINREKKNVHKSSRANHNRKSGAQWKRSKGMVPS